jgi:hypothetical protein
MSMLVSSNRMLLVITAPSVMAGVFAAPRLPAFIYFASMQYVTTQFLPLQACKNSHAKM